jgi:solute carrier family 10 (sodium/bile acid cotransporter), member 7
MMGTAFELTIAPTRQQPGHWSGNVVPSMLTKYSSSSSYNKHNSNNTGQARVPLSRSNLTSLRGGEGRGIVRAANNDQIPSDSSRLFPKLRAFADKNFFLLGMFVAVGLARAFPALGKSGGVLRPELLTGQYGVTLIFLLSGLSLELQQLQQAVANWKLNGLVQLVLFAAWPFLIGLPLRSVRVLQLPQPLLDGILITSCLPTTVNMCVILTSAASGNVAAALCNAVMSNMAGIFATPALLLRFFGSAIQLPFFNMLLKLSSKVLLPVAIGQMLRATPAKAFYGNHSKLFKRLQEVILLSILWNAFCTAISSKMGLEFRHGLVLLALLPIMHLFALGMLFLLFSWLRFPRGEVVAAMFCASQKTLAFGLPLINLVFEGSPNLAAYCAPLMFIHPIQLIIGSTLIPRLEKYVATETT